MVPGIHKYNFQAENVLLVTKLPVKNQTGP